MHHISGLHISTRSSPRRRQPARSWIEPLRRFCLMIRSSGSQPFRDGNSAWLISAAVHAGLLILLALIVLPNSSGKVLQLLATYDQGQDQENIEVLDEVAVEISQLDAFDEAQRPTVDETSHFPLPIQMEPIVPEVIVPAERRSWNFEHLDVEKLLREPDLPTPRRRVSKKTPQDLREKQLSNLAVPKNANQFGSFTIFAEPADPIDQQPYWLIIQLDLPPEKKVRKFNPLDVTGRLVGTDGFVMEIPSGPYFRVLVNGFPAMVPKPPGIQDRFHFADARARWAVWVPGANKAVKDTIQVHSKLLNEQREIQLEF